MADDTEARLRAEIEDLEAASSPAAARRAPGAATPRPRPRAASLWLLALVLAVLIVAGFLKATFRISATRRRWSPKPAAASKELPTVTVVGVERSAATGTLVLPGNIQARHGSAGAGARQRLHQKALRGYRRPREVRPAAGRNRSAGTGSAGQSGARPPLDQARAALEQASANLQQGQAQEHSPK